MTKPTVGRIVWYHPPPSDPGAATNAPLAAIIAYVWSDTLINLAVFDTNGGTYNKTSVVFIDEETAPDRPFGYAEWPTRSV